jgi:cysteine-rich repeat protein
MRALLLTPVLGLSLVACTVGQGGVGGDDVAATCGNGTIDPGETCDDRNTADGDGCSSSCQTEVTPRLDVTVDKPSVTTVRLEDHADVDADLLGWFRG